MFIGFKLFGVEVHNGVVNKSCNKGGYLVHYRIGNRVYKPIFACSLFVIGKHVSTL